MPLLIADGHHRYETALAFAEEDPSATHMLVVLVSARATGPRRSSPPTGSSRRLGDGPATRARRPGRARLPGAACSTATARYLADRDRRRRSTRRRSPGSTPRCVGYTPVAEEAVAAVDRGEAEAAFLLRPVGVEQIATRAAAGGVMPQKTTFFYPKLLSGMLFHPV